MAMRIEEIARELGFWAAPQRTFGVTATKIWNLKSVESGETFYGIVMRSNTEAEIYRIADLVRFSSAFKDEPRVIDLRDGGALITVREALDSLRGALSEELCIALRAWELFEEAEGSLLTPARRRGQPVFASAQEVRDSLDWLNAEIDDHLKELP